MAMTAVIELNEKEIQELKEKWVNQTLDKYSSLPIWEIKEQMMEKLLNDVRQKSSFGKEFYLTGTFKDQLRETFKEQVGMLVDEQVKDLRRLVKNYVHDCFIEILRDETQEILKGLIVYAPEIEQRSQEN